MRYTGVHISLYLVYSWIMLFFYQYVGYYNFYIFIYQNKFLSKVIPGFVHKNSDRNIQFNSSTCQRACYMFCLKCVAMNVFECLIWIHVLFKMCRNKCVRMLQSQSVRPLSFRGRHGRIWQLRKNLQECRGYQIRLRWWGFRWGFLSGQELHRSHADQRSQVSIIFFFFF